MQILVNSVKPFLGKCLVVIVVLLAIQHSLTAQHCISDRYSEIPVFDSSEVVILTELEYGIANHFLTSQPVSLRMDVYYPDPSIDDLEHRPFILNVHGGGFAGGDKSELASESFEFARRGFVVANINYRVGWNCENALCINCYGSNLQRAVYCGVQDVRAALRFAYDQIEEWKIDSENAFVSGESAGSIAAMLATFWNQEEADQQVAAGFSAIVGGLDNSGNDLTETFNIKAVIDQCGAVPDLEDLDNNPNIPIISFHDSNDCVVPYNTGPVIACFCSGFLSYNGSNAIFNHRIDNGECAELHTAPQPFLPNHCTYPKPNIVKLSSCFLKRIMCGYCMNFSDDDIYATPICASLYDTDPEISGCTYSSASNYNANATQDDGSCLWYVSESCAGDFDNDGIVGVSDLIVFIGQFGGVCE